jgi:AcrR family transcriptional regulator
VRVAQVVTREGYLWVPMCVTLMESSSIRRRGSHSRIGSPATRLKLGLGHRIAEAGKTVARPKGDDLIAHARTHQESHSQRYPLNRFRSGASRSEDNSQAAPSSGSTTEKSQDGFSHPKLKPGPGRSPGEVASHQRARLQSALIELVTKSGYDSVTVRDLVRRAGVSKRDYYKHFDDKESCFLSTYDLIARQSVRGILAATLSESDWRERLQVGFATLGSQVEEHPESARLVLVDAFDAGTGALERTENTTGLFEALIEKSLTGAARGTHLPPLVVKGIVTGVSRIARSRLLDGRKGGLGSDASELLDWTLTLCDEAATGLLALNGEMPPSSSLGGEEALPREDERALILAAAAKSIAGEACQELTVAGIRAVAGVSKQGFQKHFEGASECFLAAIDALGTRTLAEATPDSPGSGGWAATVHRTIAALCSQLARDPLLAKLAFLEVFAPSSMPARWRGDLVAKLALLLRREAKPGQRPSELASEASVGAIWGVIHHFVATDRTKCLPRVATTLSYLALAPAVGGLAAYESIAAEVAAPAGSRPPGQRSKASA